MKALDEIKARAQSALDFNNQPCQETPWLVDNKFEFEDILRLVKALEFALASVNPSGYTELSGITRREIDRILNGKGS